MDIIRKMTIKNMEMDTILRNMTKNIRNIQFEERKRKATAKPLFEDNMSSSDNSHGRSISIKKSTPQFGDIRVSQEETLRKTITENIKLGEEALKYFPDADDLTLDGEIGALNLRFQFRYNDPSGDGCYIWTDGLQLTETNTRTLGKIRDAFANWKDSLTQNGDLMEKLKKYAKKENNED